MTRAPMFLHLFHGRPTVNTRLDGWGADGPVLRIEGWHVTYLYHVRVGVPDPHEWQDLTFIEDLLYYDGTLYGDWSVFAEGTDPDLVKQAVPFDVTKATPSDSDREPVCPPRALDGDEVQFEDEADAPSSEELEMMVGDLADVIEAYLVHGDVDLRKWVLRARGLIGDLPEGTAIPED